MMKLSAKKLTAAVTTAAVAFSSMACACITASADTSGEPTSRYFYQDFDDEQFKDSDENITYGKWKYNAQQGSNDEWEYINNGATASKYLVADTLYLFEGDMYQNQYTLNEDGTTTINGAPIKLNDLNVKFPNSSTSYLRLTKEQMKTLGFNTDKIHFGGIDGYVGITPSIGEQSWMYQYQRGKQGVSSMMIQQNIYNNKYDSNKLFMYVKGKNSVTIPCNGYAMFGRENMDLYGKKTHISVEFTPIAPMNTNKYFTLTLTKNWGKIKDTIKERQIYATDPVALRTIFVDNDPNKKVDGGATDVVTVTNNSIYVGLVNEDNKITLSENLNFDSKTSYTIDAYIDYETNPSAPTVTAVISNSNGKIIGSKEGLLPVSDTDYTVHNISGQGSTNVFNSSGKNRKASFTADKADENNYGVFSIVNSFNNTDFGVIIDNFLFEDVTTSLSGSIGADNKTVSATLTGGKGTSGKLIAAAYDAVTNELLAVKPADVSALATEYETKTITFDNAVDANAKVKLYYWNDYSSMTPLADAYAVR